MAMPRVGQACKGRCTDLATGGTDEFLDEAFVKRFLTSYLNYSPADVDDHWASSLNMMTRNLRAYTLKAMADDDTRGKIDDGQIQSGFISARSTRCQVSRSPTWSTASRMFTICQMGPR